MDVSTWLPPLGVGISFTTVALLKIYGLSRGVVGGGGKPTYQRVCGTCPTWSQNINTAIISLFLAIGLANLAYLTFVVWCS